MVVYALSALESFIIGPCRIPTPSSSSAGMPGNLGIQNSRLCTDLISQFYACQQSQGMWEKVGGACLEVRKRMEECLYAEYVQRRTENLAASRMRMGKFKQSMEAEKDSTMTEELK